ncbi:hypothetical protein C4K10_1920 [Pseudomonas chlororaphis subsp. aureofaciens]|uniref:hypothetical protein n=1 Tax=Pseudomonas chlororaphis TaxID=587753 RepID=UPI000F70DFFE|nr:hypothetical protein [Pseudomonas chlororaphis]AZE10210.1 hypothetical protein C4K10_1920 [Pseudomonas chlororaphis subsp. aureofaciens]
MKRTPDPKRTWYLDDEQLDALIQFEIERLTLAQEVLHLVRALKRLPRYYAWSKHHA